MDIAAMANDFLRGRRVVLTHFYPISAQVFAFGYLTTDEVFVQGSASIIDGEWVMLAPAC